ncbi:unnamed protein product [Phytophthora fragariaefolia]|uniref:Unnamed protein product n=1 Tax=Phytophthora fragariaefolia TaxID=1490495 RepID=A0A9W7CSA7_9STRA|nr:unnamed protein product [Phytophthora fragariaefolia]
MVSRQSFTEPSSRGHTSEIIPAAATVARGTGRHETVSEATAQQPVEVTQTAFTAGGEGLTTQSGANGMRRPKRSQNKPKETGTSNPTARKRARRVSVESHSRRRLDHEMAQELGSSTGAISASSSIQSALYRSTSEVLCTSTSHSAPVAATTPETDSRDRPSRQRHLPSKSLFQVNWLDSQFQKHVETLNLSTVQHGNANYRSLQGHSTGLGWGRLCTVDDGGEVHIDADMETLEEYMELFDPPWSSRQQLLESNRSVTCALNQGCSVRPPMICTVTLTGPPRPDIALNSSMYLSTQPHRAFVFTFLFHFGSK